jgi:hypothetical protein
MSKYRVYIEETSARLFSQEVEADSREAATKLAKEALENDTWTEWDHSSSEVCSLEVREDARRS